MYTFSELLEHNKKKVRLLYGNYIIEDCIMQIFKNGNIIFCQNVVPGQIRGYRKYGYKYVLVLYDAYIIRAQEQLGLELLP